MRFQGRFRGFHEVAGVLQVVSVVFKGFQKRSMSIQRVSGVLQWFSEG